MSVYSRQMRFHWSLPSTGVADRSSGALARTEISQLAYLDAQLDFCRQADRLKLDSVLLPIASRAAVISPTRFVQQVNTVSALTNGRIEINVVSGQGSEELRYYGDFATHDERYQRTDEFWTICHALWRRQFPVDFDGQFIKIEEARINQPFVSPDSHRPYIYIGGSSDQARQLAIKHADGLLRVIEPPEQLAPKIASALDAGIDVGIICNMVVRRTHDDALRTGHELIEVAGERGKAAVADWRKMITESVGFNSVFQMAEDRASWLTPYLWTGLVPYLGPLSISLIGSAEEIFESILIYRSIWGNSFSVPGPAGSADTGVLRHRDPAQGKKVGTGRVNRSQWLIKTRMAMIMTMTRSLRFMWSLSAVGDSLRRARNLTTLSGLPNLAAHVEFCRRAEACGIDSVLMAFGFTRPDPIVYSAMLGAHTEKLKFLVAVRSGIFSPTYFVQQINTLSAAIDGRVAINIVAGRAPDELRYYGDFLPHDERYERTDEFWQVCHGLWRGDGPVDFTGRHYQVEAARIGTPFVPGGGALQRPEIYLGGSSDQAHSLAARHADCLLTLPDAPESMREKIRPILDSGTEVGLLVTLICRPTREEAIEAATSLVEAAGERAKELHGVLRGRSDSVGYTSTYELAMRESSWLTPYLWTGAVPYYGPPGIALVGSPDDIVIALSEYESVGVTQFLFMGHPDLEQMIFFGEEVLPRVRERAGVG